MIEKTHTPGQRVVIDVYNHPMTGKQATIRSHYGLHPTPGIGSFWGYFVQLDSGEIVGVSRHKLNLAEPKPAPLPKPQRGDLDKKVPWSACAWQPNKGQPRPHQGM